MPIVVPTYLKNVQPRHKESVVAYHVWPVLFTYPFSQKMTLNDI